MNKILKDNGVNIRIQLISTDRAISDFGRMGFHSNWDYSYLGNTTILAYSNVPWLVAATVMDSYNWWNNKVYNFECYVRLSDKTGGGAIGSNMKGDNPVIYIPSMDTAKRKLKGKPLSDEEIIANVLLHEIIFHGVLKKSDIPLFLPKSWQYPKDSLFHGVSPATKPVEIPKPQAIIINKSIK